MLGHKMSLNTFKKTEIISHNFSNHKSMRQEINSKKLTRKEKKNNKYMEAKDMIRNNQWINKVIKETKNT